MGEILTAFDRILEGFWVTLQVTVYGALGALVIAFIAGLMGLSPSFLVRAIARVFVETFRGTSLLVQLFWWFYVLPFLGIQLEPLAAGVVAMATNYGAYGSEVVRGAILAVPKEQREATVALSMTPLQRMRLVLLPQAIVGMIPPFTNLLVQLLKGSALVSLITLVDITRAATQVRGETGETVVPYTAALVIYFVLAQAMIFGMRLWERHAKARIGQPLPPLFGTRVTPKEVQGVAG
ncbi:MAG: ectoine/hydroxyectoine ABC transporter permease subunit EhuC [Dehalococcoidia bacterium]